jgi:DDE superfamily endonuclease
MDNLPAHKVPGVKELIEASGATVQYLPQYSPDLNPIPAKGLRADCSWPVPPDRLVRANHQSCRMSQLLQTCRLCVDMVGICFNLSPTRALNIGCAEGYYAIGFALRLPQAKVFAAETDPKSLCAARRNAVTVSPVVVPRDSPYAQTRGDTRSGAFWVIGEKLACLLQQSRNWPRQILD